ncbi:hypothetical protein Cgig2_029759 [Carnegiea gigantea]|uniref:RNase H type-1 domain-containing protein n=1 Tax=Carnegiea gigantea TaxID=171969 RepID=A0A9Q1K3V8_9CARY|nr:hypothetical protein Cgig2_029759 [Carnegiea gigantea]
MAEKRGNSAVAKRHSDYLKYGDANTLRLLDCLLKAIEQLTHDEFGEFLAVMWECWNARNHFIFKTRDCYLDKLGKRAISYIRSYSGQQEIDSFPSTVPHPSTWTPPTTSCVKINFDGGSIGGTHSGWGFAIRDHHGNLLLAGTKHTPREESRVAHDLAHWEPLCSEGRLWESDVPAAILDRASDNMYLYIHNNLI